MGETYDAGKSWRVTLALAAFMMINFIDKIVLGLVAVPMMDELGLTPQQFGAIGAASSGCSPLPGWPAAFCRTASRPDCWCWA